MKFSSFDQPLSSNPQYIRVYNDNNFLHQGDIITKVDGLYVDGDNPIINYAKAGYPFHTVITTTQPTTDQTKIILTLPAEADFEVYSFDQYA